MTCWMTFTRRLVILMTSSEVTNEVYSEANPVYNFTISSTWPTVSIGSVLAPLVLFYVNLGHSYTSLIFDRRSSKTIPQRNPSISTMKLLNLKDRQRFRDCSVYLFSKFNFLALYPVIIDSWWFTVDWIFSPISRVTDLSTTKFEYFIGYSLCRRAFQTR